MKTWRLVLASAWLLGCTAVNAAADGVPTDGLPADWDAVMGEVDRACGDLDRLLLEKPQGDLATAALRADRAAAVVRLGYGALEDRTVPDFAQLARDCESWFLQVALEARQGRGELAADRYRTGYERHCNRCHDAHDRVHG